MTDEQRLTYSDIQQAAALYAVREIMSRTDLNPFLTETRWQRLRRHLTIRNIRWRISDWLRDLAYRIEP